MADQQENNETQEVVPTDPETNPKVEAKFPAEQVTGALKDDAVDHVMNVKMSYPTKQ